MSPPTSGSSAHSGGPARGPQATPPNRRWTLLLGTCAGLALVLLITAGAVAIYRAGPRPAASSPVGPVATASPAVRSPTPTQSPSPSPSPTPRPSLTPEVPLTPPSRRPVPSGTPSATSTPRPGPDQSLRGNALYDIDLDGHRVGCDLVVRSPRPPLKDKALAPYLRQVADCLVRAFGKPLAAEGITLTAPKVKTYHKTVKTPCGTYGQDKAPAFYCSATETIYWADTSDNGREAYSYARLGYVALMAHEFGHHLQTVTGMLTEYGGDYYATEKKSDRYALSRRLELQAQCFEGVFLNQTARSLKLSGTDRDQLEAWHGFTGDEDPPDDRLPDHGTSAAQIRWLERGLDSGDFGTCNTWKASRKSVR